jgi:catechol 2,3-dioxygenase-like lactoylglutathione lyase family enzyme
MKLNAIVATLPCRDLAATSAFYSRLGFEEKGRWDDYMIMVSGPHELHFAKPEDGFLKRGQNPSGIYLRVSDIEDWAKPFGAKIETTDYNMRQFALGDPDENLIRIGEYIIPPGGAV